MPSHRQRILTSLLAFINNIPLTYKIVLFIVQLVQSSIINVVYKNFPDCRPESKIENYAVFATNEAAGTLT
jgi:MFS-type transporter involved in bile tolerance (Atg22 family)